jgi:hypothetical protein
VKTCAFSFAQLISRVTAAGSKLCLASLLVSSAALGTARPMPAALQRRRSRGATAGLKCERALASDSATEPRAQCFPDHKREVARADVVHLYAALYPVHMLALVLARRNGKPVVLAQHIAAIPYRNQLLRLLTRAMNRLLARPMLACADQVVFISKLTTNLSRPARDAGR